ncbi:hypothetical protein RND71_024456 [Anisodus tanguticus]|uniref:Uncharacterized protein n=1 Tax=Anisodus tanguticus TaxID=243964 RepID=A0AAE1RPT1_9SOLA|nr:hypothetical protein RND71_024456 [Anisodus tanguticus]
MTTESITDNVYKGNDRSKLHIPCGCGRPSPLQQTIRSSMSSSTPSILKPRITIVPTTVFSWKKTTKDIEESPLTKISAMKIIRSNISTVAPLVLPQYIMSTVISSASPFGQLNWLSREYLENGQGLNPVSSSVGMIIKSAIIYNMLRMSCITELQNRDRHISQENNT